MKKLLKIKLLAVLILALSIGILSHLSNNITSHAIFAVVLGQRQTSAMVGDYFIHPMLNFDVDGEDFDQVEIIITNPDGSAISSENNANRMFTLPEWKTWAAGNRQTDFQFDRAGNFGVSVIIKDTISGLNQPLHYTIAVGAIAGPDGCEDCQLFPCECETLDPSVFDDGLRLHFIDVGQGDVAVIELPSGDVIMIDAGGGNLAAPQIRAYNTIYAYLRRYIFPGNALMPIALFIATHSHADHIGTFDRLMPHMKIDHIVRPISFHPNEIAADIPYEVFGLLPPYAAHDTALLNRVVNRMAEQQQNHGTKITLPYRGKTIDTFDCVDIIFYSPTSHFYGMSGGIARINPLSTIFSVNFQGRRLMFTGDAYVENELSLLELCEDGYTVFGTREGEIYKVDILDVGHHGSTTSTAMAFLQKIQPTYAIIQVGTAPANGGSPQGNDNTHGHPHGVVMDRLHAVGANIILTRDVGNILILISPCGTYMEVGADPLPPPPCVHCDEYPCECVPCVHCDEYPCECVPCVHCDEYPCECDYNDGYFVSCEMLGMCGNIGLFGTGGGGMLLVFLGMVLIVVFVLAAARNKRKE